MNKYIYTVKSFIVLGDSLKNCYNCDYCRADDNIDYSYHLLPSKVNKLFRNLPVAVNLFYGDPILQLDNTINFLENLNDDNHNGIVALITKGKLVNLPKFDINLHIGITIGPDKISQDNFEYNLDLASKSGYKFSIEYRPICKNINNSDKFIEYVISKAKEYNTCLSYSGLQLPPKGIDNDKYKPYDNRKFNSQKYIGKDIENKIQQISNQYNVNVFKKSSCLISFMHNLNRDYNAHFLKPKGVGCSKCPNLSKCSSFTASNLYKLPFEYDLVKKDNYKCSFVRNGLCKFPNEECLNMEGYFIHPKLDTITRGDARIIKWLTGCMVDSVENLIETPFISDFWNE